MAAGRALYGLNIRGKWFHGRFRQKVGAFYSNKRGPIWVRSRFRGFYAALPYWSKRSIRPAKCISRFHLFYKTGSERENVHHTHWQLIRVCSIFWEKGFHKRLVYNKHMQGIILGLGVIRMSFQIFDIYMDTDTPEPSRCHAAWKSRQWYIRLGRRVFLKVW